MSDLFQDFIVQFSEHLGVRSRSNRLNSTKEKFISIKAWARQAKTISEAELRGYVSDYVADRISLYNQKQLYDNIFNKAAVTLDDGEILDAGTLTENFITSFKEEVGLNSIKRNPGHTVLSFLLTGGGAVGLTLLAIFLFETITATSFLPLLLTAMPFMTALGPLGAIVLFTAFIAVTALLICGAVVGITAKATEKTVAVIREDNPLEGNPLSGLSQPRSNWSLGRTQPPAAEADVNSVNPPRRSGSIASLSNTWPAQSAQPAQPTTWQNPFASPSN